MRILDFSARIIVAVAAAVLAPSGLAMGFVPGDLYTSRDMSRTVRHYSANGTFIDAYEMPASYGDSVRGIAFGPNGLLYLTTVLETNFAVIAIDQSGVVRETYSGEGYIRGGTGYGKITFGESGKFYVGASSSLVEFIPGNSIGNSLYYHSQVYDSKVLPSGNILVLSGYEIQEITDDGDLVRTIKPSIHLSDARGIEFDATTDSIFVTMLGYTGEEWRVMKLNGQTGFVENRITYRYAEDLYLTHDNRLLVGSITEFPGIFDLDLEQIGILNTSRQMFVTEMPVPEPSTIALLSVGLAALGLVRRGKSPRLLGNGC